MSRLDSFIRRMTAQRDCIDWIAARLTGPPNPAQQTPAGVILELGYGNGRTYHHLRESLPNWHVLVFDRVLPRNPAPGPPPDLFFLGEFAKTLPTACAAIGPLAQLAHCDFGSGRPTLDRETALGLPELLDPLLRDGAFILSDQPLYWHSWHPLPLPATVAAQRYFLCRKQAA